MSKQMSSLEGKTVIVAGASSGIGLATAQAAASDGAKVIIISGNEQRMLKALSTLPASCEGYAVDLSAEQNIQQFFAQCQPFDHLVYTAGEHIMLNDLATTDLEAARDYFNIRYWGAVAAVKYGAPLINRNGSVSLTGGIASIKSGKGWWLGSSICGAMDSFTRAMAIELAPIRVNLVSPGVVKTNLWNSMDETARTALYANMAATLPVQKVGAPEDIAQAFLYLMKQPYSTGQRIVVDGGATII